MEKNSLSDKPGKGKKLLRAFYVLLVIVCLSEFFIHKHPHFPWEEWPGFYAAFGFVAFAGLILVAKYILRPIVKRKEDYYD
jgi:hypothetical protein